MKSTKRIFTLILALVCTGMTMFGQTPAKIKYQVVARDANNAVLQEQQVDVQIDILQGSATGTSILSEQMNTTTNFDGLLTLEMDVANVDWNRGPYFIQTTVDGKVISTVQLLSVPYAFYAQKTGTDFSGKYADLTNKPEIPVIPMKTGDYVNDAPYVTTEAQDLSIEGDKLTISNSNTVTLPTANKIEYVEVGQAKAGDMLYWDNEKQAWQLIKAGETGDILAYFDKNRPEWAMVDSTGKLVQKKETGCGTLTDIDGNEYKTVIIGNQCWMAENLRTKTLPNGTALEPMANSYPSFSSSKRYYYEREDDVVGHIVVYPWNTVNNRSGSQTDQNAKIQGICPDGWHVPTYKQFADMCNVIDPEWDRGTMATVSGAYTLNSSNKLGVKLADPNCMWKSIGVINSLSDYEQAGTESTTEDSPGWNYTHNIVDPDANSSGFNAKVSGYWKNGSYTYNGALMLWTAIGSSPTGYARYVSVSFAINGIYHTGWSSSAKEGYGVRCVSDETFGE